MEAIAPSPKGDPSLLKNFFFTPFFLFFQTKQAAVLHLGLGKSGWKAAWRKRTLGCWSTAS